MDWNQWVFESMYGNNDTHEGLSLLPHYYRNVLAKRKRGNAAFNDDDLVVIKADLAVVRAEREEKRREEAARKHEEALEWQALKKRRFEAPGPPGPPPEEPELWIFRVEAPVDFLNHRRWDMFSSFVCVAPSEGDARRIHPRNATVDACKYMGDELSRELAWERAGGKGDAPGWFVCEASDWVHGAYASVELISKYTPADKTKALKAGSIISSDFHAG